MRLRQGVSVDGVDKLPSPWPTREDFEALEAKAMDRLGVADKSSEASLQTHEDWLRERLDKMQKELENRTDQVGAAILGRLCTMDEAGRESRGIVCGQLVELEAMVEKGGLVPGRCDHRLQYLSAL